MDHSVPLMCVSAYCSNPNDIVRAEVPFALCLEKFGHPQQVEDFYSSELKKNTLAEK